MHAPFLTKMLDFLFSPRSIAIIGASDNPEKIGHALVKNLIEAGFSGKIYPINPKKNKILNLPVYSSVTKLPDIPELAIIAVPAKVVLQVLEECGQKGVKGVVVITAGFKETGEEGAILEKKILRTVKHYNMRMVGPNCLGIINTKVGLNATFAPDFPPPGRASLFSQSGALGVALIDWAIENNFGFSKFVSLGNKADLNECDFLEYFGEDPETDIILGYIEDVSDGKRFIEVASKVARKKPVILIKAGSTKTGARAASSHTGALAGSETAFREAFKKTGIIRVYSIKELFETAEVFKLKTLPHGDSLLIITNAGGPGIIAADTADLLGLKVEPLDEKFINALIDKLPSAASLYNPVDVLGDATSERYAMVLEEALKHSKIEGICIIATAQATTDIENIAKLVSKKTQTSSKPIIACFVGGRRVKKGIEILKREGVPCYSDPSIAIQAYSKLVKFSMLKGAPEEKPAEIQIPQENKEKVRLILETLQNAGISFVGEENSMEILSLYGFSFPKRGLARTPEEAVEIAQKIGYPVVLKIVCPQILHKTEVGGVKLNLNSDEEVYEKFLEMTSRIKRIMPQAFIKGVMVYEMVQGGKEVILGVSVDKTFGHLIMFGLGGIYVEVLKDVSFRIIPLTYKEAQEMIKEVKGSKILDGVRGEAPYDKEAVVDALLRLSQLVKDFPIIKEIDINPFMVQHIGAKALDARIII